MWRVCLRLIQKTDQQLLKPCNTHGSPHPNELLVVVGLTWQPAHNMVHVPLGPHPGEPLGCGYLLQHGSCLYWFEPADGHFLLLLLFIYCIRGFFLHIERVVLRPFCFAVSLFKCIYTDLKFLTNIEVSQFYNCTVSSKACLVWEIKHKWNGLEKKVLILLFSDRTDLNYSVKWNGFNYDNLSSASFHIKSLAFIIANTLL